MSMATAYYDKVQERAAAGALAPLLDGFLRMLDERGYSRTSRRANHLGAIHVGAWCQRVHIEIADLDEAAVGRFERHLPRCACRVLRPGSAEQSAGDLRAAKHVLDYLRSRGIAKPAPE